MTTSTEKFLRKLQPKTKDRIKNNILRIKEGRLIDSDIKKLKNKNNLYRLRVGRIRIIFKKEKGKFEIVRIDARKDVYRNP